MRKIHRLLLLPIPLSLLFNSALAQTEPAVELTDPAKAAEAVKLVEDEANATKAPTPKKDTFAKTSGEGVDNAAIFAKFSADERAKISKLLQDASTYVGGIRIQEAFEKLIEAEAMAPELFAIHNLKGAAYTKIRDFGKARKSFEKALTIAPDAFMARFNLLELNFVEGRWPEADAGFKKLVDGTKEMNDSTKGLINFKRYVCCLKQNKTAEAKALMESFNYLSDTPEYYYAHAAKHFQAEEKEDAHRWMKSAEKIYEKRQQEIFLDSLIEVGWLDNLQ